VRLLLDTHAVLWWFADDPALPGRMEALIDDPLNTILVSAASAWEVCTKVRIGKLSTGSGLCEDFVRGPGAEHWHAVWCRSRRSGQGAICDVQVPNRSVALLGHDLPREFSDVPL
jgi:hypothetical protein